MQVTRALDVAIFYKILRLHKLWEILVGKIYKKFFNIFINQFGNFSWNNTRNLFFVARKMDF